MAFCPQVLGGGRDLCIIILLKMNAVSVVITCEVVGTLNWYKIVEHFFELCALRGSEDVKTFQLSLAP